MQLEDHAAALRILALVLGDIRLAEAYCARWAGQQGYLALLDMLLHPGDGRAPLYAEACHLLAAQGGSPLHSLTHFPATTADQMWTLAIRVLGDDPSALCLNISFPLSVILPQC